MEDGWKRLSCRARNGAQRQGKKVARGRCGRTIEAKPVSGQTCPIEPAGGQAWIRPGRNHDMAAAASAHRFSAGFRWNDLPGSLPQVRHPRALRTEARPQHGLPLPACERARARHYRQPSGAAPLRRKPLRRGRLSAVHPASAADVEGLAGPALAWSPRHAQGWCSGRCISTLEEALTGGDDLVASGHRIPAKFRPCTTSWTSDRHRNRRRRPQAGSVPQA